MTVTANPNRVVADGTLLTPLNPIPAGQYGPSFWASNCMLRRDDKPQYIQTPAIPVAPGFGRGN